MKSAESCEGKPRRQEVWGFLSCVIYSLCSVKITVKMAIQEIVKLSVIGTSKSLPCSRNPSFQDIVQIFLFIFFLF